MSPISKTQYLLTTQVAASGNGTVGSGGYFDANSIPTITATPSANYKFVSWSGATVTSSTSASTTVTMSGPESVTASFTLNTVGITVQTSQTGMSFVADTDPTVYTSAHLLNWNIGDTHVLKVAATQAGPTGIQYVFMKWSDKYVGGE